MKSVESFNQCQSVMQTIYDILKAHGGVPMAIGMKVETKEGEGLPAGQAGTEFVIHLPL